MIQFRILYPSGFSHLSAWYFTSDITPADIRFIHQSGCDWEIWEVRL